MKDSCESNHQEDLSYASLTNCFCVAVGQCKQNRPIDVVSLHGLIDACSVTVMHRLYVLTVFVYVFIQVCIGS